MKENHARYALARANGVPPREAAISVGFAANSAHVTASRLDQRDDIRKAIAKYRRSGKSDIDTTADDSKESPKSYLKPRYDTPLALLEDLMNNAKAPDGVRIEAAKLALPYRHGKVAEGGKKEKAENDAKKGAKQGKFKVKSGPGRPVATRMMN
jgi:phage terminase small subunit